MSYPPVRPFGTGLREVEQPWNGRRQARRIALSARRCQEVELRRHPASRPVLTSGDRRVGVMRASAAAFAAIVLAVVIVYTVTASVGAY
jgi:hypothetical protein